jgi:hypothetical protein
MCTFTASLFLYGALSSTAYVEPVGLDYPFYTYGAVAEVMQCGKLSVEADISHSQSLKYDEWSYNSIAIKAKYRLF